VVLVGLLAVLVAAQPTVDDLRLMAEIGPVDGWQCAREPTYSYESGRRWFSGGLFQEPPEALIDGGGVESVEVDRRTGEAVIWTRQDGQQRVYVLEPGRLSTVTDPARQPICVHQLGNWQIVGEHALG